METYRHPFLSEPYGAFTWCARCLRAYRTATWVEHAWRCPNPECSVPASYAYRWETVLKNHPGLPEEPEEGEAYPLYRFDASA